MMEVTESPVYLLFDGTPNPLRKSLPVTLFETELRVVNEAPLLTFAEATYSIQARPALSALRKCLPSAGRRSRIEPYS